MTKELIEQLAKKHLKSTKSDGLSITYSLDELEAFAKAYQAQSEQQEAVAPELFWNKGDEYVMHGNEEVFNWAADNDYSHGESFDLEYSITGTATFLVDGDTVELADFAPKYYTSPPKQAIPDGWISVDDRLPELKDDSVLAHFENGSIETIHIEDYFKPITNGFDEAGKQLYTKWYLHHNPKVSYWQYLPPAPTNTEVGND